MVHNSTSLLLKWIPPNSPPGYTTGYRITFTGGGRNGSVDINDTSTNNYTLSNLTEGVVYEISIAGKSEHFFSDNVTILQSPGIIVGK